MNQLNLTESDKSNLSKQNISFDSIKRQFDFIANNQHFTEVHSPCKLENGVIHLNIDDKIDLINQFKIAITYNQLIKFVPASGASSRMFAFLIKYFHYLVDEKISISEKEQLDVDYFFDNLHKFSFFELLPLDLTQKSDNNEIDLKFRYEILNNLLFNTQDNNEIFGLNYANEAKGNIKFHKVKINNEEFTLNAFESHIWEHIELAINDNSNLDFIKIIENLVPIEFSVSEELYYHYNESENQEVNYEVFENLIKLLEFKFPNQNYKVENIFNKFREKVTYSKQDKSTNSVAFDKDFNLMRQVNGNLITRAGGHGTLIYNIQEINQDYIFIKNIDNIAKLDLQHEINQNSQELIGFTKIIKEKIDFYLSKLIEINPLVNDIDLINEVSNFVKKYLVEDFEGSNYDDSSTLQNDLINILDRPLRVVAVVKNTGEPGGGPFYVKLNDEKNDILSQFNTKQIIELSQIDMTNEHQKSIVENSLYFNPVFMVLNTKNPNGEKYNLLNYMSESMAMVVEKTHGTETIKSYEYPGLWNGAMAYWNTIFVEMPSIIFHPVKTVNDLLKEGHL